VLFHTQQYGLFLLGVFVAFWSLRKLPGLRLPLLLVASLYFYSRHGVRWLSLLLVVSTLDWAIALAIGRSSSRTARRALVALGVSANLVTLGVFKYASMVLETVHTLFPASASDPAPEPWALVLPIGVSFYTFQGIGYLVDVHRSVIRPERSLGRLALFLSFFPLVSAGPIARARDLLPQLRRLPMEQSGQGGVALALILQGLVKKLVLGDQLALQLVDRIFDLPTHFSSLEVGAACYGYAFQIYFDFSGYTDIALGSAALMGIRLPENFDQPYLARNLQDFWRRWHMSLSTWRRDYLYVPLGGSRHGTTRMIAALILTMALGGLWHGAGWTFLLWGFLHGLALAIHRLIRIVSTRVRRGRARSLAGATRVASTLLTFHVVVALWVLFRSESMDAALDVYRQIWALVPGTTNLSPHVVLLLVAATLGHFVPTHWETRLRTHFSRLPALAQALVAAGVIHGVIRWGVVDAAPFVYFQF